MNESSFQTLDKNFPKNHLPALETPFGTRSIYGAVSYCNRCGSCLHVCPTYLLTQEEPFSPRGRNQLARLLLERKLKLTDNLPLIQKSVFSCTLCGACSQVCAGNIPTAHFVLEMRRLLKTRVLPTSLYWFLSLRETHPDWFSRLTRAGLWLRQWGFIKLIRFSGLANLCGLSWLHRADKLVPKFQKTVFEKARTLLVQTDEKPALIYLPSLEAEFLLPEILVSSYRAAAQKFRTVIWPNTATGLFAYVYGDVRRARYQLKKLILRHQACGELPLVTDSLEVFQFLKQAPTLFTAFPRWQQKARRLSVRVEFITSFILPGKNQTVMPVTLCKESLFYSESFCFESAQRILQTIFEKNFVECNYPVYLPTYGYSFGKENRFKQIAPLVVKPVLEKQIKTVVSLSGWSVLEWRALTKKHDIKVLHIAQLNR